MEAKQEILEAIDILVQAALKDATKIYTCIVRHASGNKCTVLFNGEEHIVNFMVVSQKSMWHILYLFRRAICLWHLL